MVVFACVSCGASLKKNDVIKHRARCSMNAVSCMDCHQDFDFTSYAFHTKCVTEEQRVQGSLYKVKEDKTEMKRQAWYNAIEKAIAESQNQKIIELLNKIQNEPNVPMKLPAFTNFVKNKNYRGSDYVIKEAFNAINTIYVNTKEVSQQPVKKADEFDYNQAVKDLMNQCPSEGISIVNAFRIIVASHREFYPEANIDAEEICNRASTCFIPYLGKQIIVEK